MYEFAVAPAVTNIRRRGVEISEVSPASLGAEMDLEPGDRIIKVNCRTIRDYLDFRFHTAGETELLLEVRKKSGEDWELELERAENEDFGFSFEQIVPRQCANECLFCFCKGNPTDARPSLFVRDEDIRLSFLYGNYTTLSSITEDELQRIIEQRLSPQYVSVHATDLTVRAYLLGVDEQRADITQKMQRMLDAGIEIHAQVVLCPQINDGEILRRTIYDLAKLHPRVRSVAIVPLGLTRYLNDERLTPVTAEFCGRTINEVSIIQDDLRDWQRESLAQLGIDGARLVQLPAGCYEVDQLYSASFPGFAPFTMISYVDKFPDANQKTRTSASIRPIRMPSRQSLTRMATSFLIRCSSSRRRTRSSSAISEPAAWRPFLFKTTFQRLKTLLST